MNKKTSIILGIVVLILIIIFGTIGWSNKTAKAPEVSNSGDSTSTTTQASSSTSTSTASSGLSVVLSTSTQIAYTGPAFSLIYPKPWTYLPAVDFSINTFGGKYKSDGTLPAGGAEVDIATTTAYGPVQDIINTELMNAMDVATSTITVGKIACEKASFQANYAPGATSQDISIYCSRGTALWKIYFSYGINDPAASTHISDFNSMLASMKFLP